MRKQKLASRWTFLKNARLYDVKVIGAGSSLFPVVTLALFVRSSPFYIVGTVP
jgi:hypothetical protein